jgi:DNA repair protein RadC
LEAFLRATAIAEPVRVAAKLSEHYSTLSELLSADPAIVASYSGAAAALAIAETRMLMISALEEDLSDREPFSCPRDAEQFLKGLIGFCADELLIVLFLDSRRRLIDYEVAAAGSVDGVDFDPRRILFRAMGRGAAGIIIAHNHPSGDSRPSNADFRLTRRLADTARGLGICLHDHLVVAGGEVRSAL